MKEVRYFYVPDALHSTELPPEEARHALRVLRLGAVSLEALKAAGFTPHLA